MIPFPVQEYLGQYLAFVLNQKMISENGVQSIVVDRHTELGRIILQSLEVSYKKPVPLKGVLHIQVSPFAGNNYNDTPNGRRCFYTIGPKAYRSLSDWLKLDFEEAVFNYSQGAEFAHKVNGWTPDQKRKGIRKRAILEFCKLHGVSPDKRSFDSLFKMVQRRLYRRKNNRTAGLSLFAQGLSY